MSNDNLMKCARAKLDFINAKQQLNELRDAQRAGPPYCSFCRRGKGQYLFCIEGRSGSRICEECVFDCYEKVIEELNAKGTM